MKKRILFLLCAAMLLLCACGGETAPAETPASDEAPAAETQPAASESGPAVRQIHLLNARANDSDTIELAEDAHFLARAVLPDENSFVDHWEVNGKKVNAGSRLYSLEFDSEGVFLVEAFLRERKAVDCVNCYLQFLDDKGNAAGEKYSYVSFEEAYIVPTTNEVHAAGSISAQITAIVPAGQSVDYWIINGTAVHYTENVVSFIFVGLNGPLTIEAVMKSGAGGTPVTSLIGDYDPGNNKGTLPEDRPDDDKPIGKEISSPWKLIDPVQGKPLDSSPSPSPEGTTGNENDGHTHNWQYTNEGSWAATCTQDGRYHYVCTICGADYYQTIPGGHQFSWVSEGITWNLGGTHTQVCSVCGARGQSQYHNIVSEGNGWFHCTICGDRVFIVN